MHIDWLSTETEILLNPRTPKAIQEKIDSSLSLFHSYKGHIWLSTSGSSCQQTKFVALSKEALLVSAQAVNTHLGSHIEDRWVNPLPHFHVGGLGIWCRSFLNQAKVFSCEGKWNPIHFYNLLCKTRATLSSMVPTQVYDIVSANLKAPKSLRAVIVGGGKIHEQIFNKARELGWPLLLSYGMTESSSQIATALSNYPSQLKILPHMRVKINEEGIICLKSPSLLTSYAILKEQDWIFSDPKNEGWLLTEDRGELNDPSLIVHGRNEDFIKIGGESVSLSRLENLLEQIKLNRNISFDIALIAIPDARLGHVIHLVSTHYSPIEIQLLLEEYHRQTFPFEHIREVHQILEIPRTCLGKIMRKQLLQLLAK